jgi:hypothetical protein
MEFNMACQELGIGAVEDIKWNQTSEQVRQCFEGSRMAQLDFEGLLWKWESNQTSTRQETLANQFVTLAHRYYPRAFTDVFTSLGKAALNARIASLTHELVLANEAKDPETPDLSLFFPRHGPLTSVQAQAAREINEFHSIMSTQKPSPQKAFAGAIFRKRARVMVDNVLGSINRDNLAKEEAAQDQAIAINSLVLEYTNGFHKSSNFMVMLMESLRLAPTSFLTRESRDIRSIRLWSWLRLPKTGSTSYIQFPSTLLRIT